MWVSSQDHLGYSPSYLEGLIEPQSPVFLGTDVAPGRDFSPTSYISLTSLGYRALRVGILEGVQAVSTKLFSALIRISSYHKAWGIQGALN